MIRHSSLPSLCKTCQMVIQSMGSVSLEIFLSHILIDHSHSLGLILLVDFFPALPEDSGGRSHRNALPNKGVWVPAPPGVAKANPTLCPKPAGSAVGRSLSEARVQQLDWAQVDLVDGSDRQKNMDVICSVHMHIHNKYTTSLVDFNHQSRSLSFCVRLNHLLALYSSRPSPKFFASPASTAAKME